METAAGRWQDWVNLVFGAWLFVSPSILGYFSQGSPESWNFIAVGTAIMLLSLIALNTQAWWEEAINAVFGIWMIVSPWVLNYSGNALPRDNSIVVGLLMGAASLWVIADKVQGQHRASIH